MLSTKFIRALNLACGESGSPYSEIKEISEEEAQKSRKSLEEFGDRSISAGESIELANDGVFYHRKYKRYYKGIRKEWEMINVKQVREVFNVTNSAQAFSDEGFKKITDLCKFEDKASVDVALICG